MEEDTIKDLVQDRITCRNLINTQVHVPDHISDYELMFDFTLAELVGGH